MLKIFIECASPQEAMALIAHQNTLRGTAQGGGQTAPQPPQPPQHPYPQPASTMPMPAPMPAPMGMPQPQGMPQPTSGPGPAPMPMPMPAPQQPAGMGMPQPQMPAPMPAPMTMPAPQPAQQQGGVTFDHMQQAIGAFVTKYSAAQLLGYLQQNFNVSASRDIPPHRYAEAYNALSQA